MKKILIVIDVQNDFTTGSLGSKEAQKAVSEVIKAIKKNREEQDALIFTMDTHGEDYLQTFEGRNLPVEHCLKGSEGHAFDKALLELGEDVFAKDCTVLEKGGFGSAELPEAVKKACGGITDDVQVFFCGLCTDICVIVNALLLRAVYPSMSIKVIEGACAGSSVENHEAALKVMKACQIYSDSY